MRNYNPFRYRGYYYDTETGFYYLQSRYYDPAICRFINADAYTSTEQGFLGYNMFAYCENNPVTGYDPTGEWNLCGVLLGISVMAVAVLSVATLGVPLIAGALGVTGAVMTYAAATDSAMVMDGSYSIPTKAGEFAKVGNSIIVDFGENGGIYSYAHGGFGFGTLSGVSYEIGIVTGFEEPEDYSKHFIDYTAGGQIGFDHCFDPTRDYTDTTKAYCVTFSSSNGYGVGYDYYSPPIELIKWRARNR